MTIETTRQAAGRQDPGGDRGLFEDSPDPALSPDLHETNRLSEQLTPVSVLGDLAIEVDTESVVASDLSPEAIARRYTDVEPASALSASRKGAVKSASAAYHNDTRVALRLARLQDDKRLRRPASLDELHAVYETIDTGVAVHGQVGGDYTQLQPTQEQALIDMLVGHQYMLTANIGLVKKSANYFLHHTPIGMLSYDDLFAAGVTGLVNAAQAYDPTRGYLFSTYATFRVNREMYRIIKKESPAIPAASLDAPLQDGSPMGELIRDPTNTVDILLTTMARLQVLQSLLDNIRDTKGTAKTTPMMQGVIALRYGIRSEVFDKVTIPGLEDKGTITEIAERAFAAYEDDRLTMEEIGDILGKSRSRICQLHDAAIASMRKNLKLTA
jgi:RNA polymerase sigma factor (sigma-70 family)